MSAEATRKKIYQVIEAGWDKVAFPLTSANNPFPGAGGTQPTKPWARYAIRYASNQNIDVGGRSRRATGRVWLQIFIPENGGERPAAQMNDALDALFGNKTFTTDDSVLRFERAELGYVGKDGGFDQHRSTILFIEDAYTP